MNIKLFDENSGKIHDDITKHELGKLIDPDDIKKVIKSLEDTKKEEINTKSTQYKYPIELVKIFKTLGMHAPTGIRPPGAAVHRAKINMRRKASRGR